MIAIIDYDAGNIKSVEKALLYLGEDVHITRDREEILSSDKIILPGVGAFGEAMDKLREYRLLPVIYDAVEKKIPFLGICLGMQLMFESSEESQGVAGLGLLKGRIMRIPAKEGIKIPHMGWNDLQIREDSRLFRGISDHSYVYFVHSYYLKAEEDCVAAVTDYGVEIHAAIEKENLFGCQFHPEKSSETGLSILKNFVQMR